MAAALKDAPQIGLLDQFLEDDELLEELEIWQDAHDAARAPQQRFRQINAQVKARLEELDLPEGTHRCGRFSIKVGLNNERHIEFERTSKRAFRIKAEDDE